MLISLFAGASGGEGAALHPRRVFDPFETHFAIFLVFFFMVERAC